MILRLLKKKDHFSQKGKKYLLSILNEYSINCMFELF